MQGKTNAVKIEEKEVITQVGIPTTIGTTVYYHRTSSSNLTNGIATFSVPAGKKIIGIATRIYGTEQLWIDVENKQTWYAGVDSNYAYRVCPESASMIQVISDNVVKIGSYTNPSGYTRGWGNNTLSWIIAADV